MDMTIDQQVALDKALVPHASRLRIGKSNFRLRLDITSKESTLQVETVTVHHHSIRFKMNNKKRIVNLEYFREMLHICLRIPNHTFDELLFEEEILAFLRYLGHSGEIKKITDVNINKLHQPWRSYATVINKCLSGKSTGYDSLRFTKVIINFFMTKGPSIPRRNKFSTILPVELTNKDIKNFAAYKEYYAIASGAAPPKTKASVRKTQSSFDTTITPPTAAGIRLSTLAKGIQPAKSSKAKEDDDQDDNDDDQDSNTDGDDLVHPKLSTHDEEAKDEESFDPIVQTPSHEEKSNDEGNDDVNLGMNVGGNEGPDAKDDDDELYGDLNINLEGREVQMIDVHTIQLFEDTHVTLTPVNPDGQQQSSSMSSQFVSNMLNPSLDVGIDSLFESTPRVDVQVMATVVPLPLTAPTRPLPSIPTISQVQQAPALKPTTSTLHDLLDFSSLFEFNHRLKNLEANFSEFMQTNQFAGAVFSNLGIVDRYIDHRMNEAIKTSYVVAADLSELELKNILIDKMESNKSIHRSDEQKNLYKALVDAYECDKIILDTYGDTVTLKRRRDDADKDEEPSAGSDRGSKRRREGKEPELTSALKEKASKTTATHGSIQPWISDLAKKADSRTSFNELMDAPVDFSTFLMNRLKVDTLTPELLAGPTYELMKGSRKSLVELKFFLEEVYKATTDQLDWNNPEGQQYPYNLLKPLPLIPNSRGRRVIPFDHFINNDLEYLCGGASSRKYTTSVTKTKAADYGHIKSGLKTWEYARDVYSKRRIIAVTELQIVKWHNYKHLDWITVRRDDDKLYKFKEGDLKRLRIQDIKKMMLLLV
nr:hypothetical protein [Tanacetum cinerariifolium]